VCYVYPLNIYGDGLAEFDVHYTTMSAKKLCMRRKNEFPSGDVLGVILSYVGASCILKHKLYSVCREWMWVLCNLPHAWGSIIDLRDVSEYLTLDVELAKRFSWHYVKELISGNYSGNVINLITPKSLKYLDLRGACANTRIFPWGDSVEELIMGEGAWLIDDDIAELIPLPLKKLTLGYCDHLTSDAFEMISNMFELEYIDFGSQCEFRLTNSVLSYFQDMDNLKYLGASMFRCSEVTNDGLRYLSTLKLQCLKLAGQFTDEGLDYITNMPLEYLVLNGDLTDDGLVKISSLPLKKLVLRGLFSDHGLTHIASLSLEFLGLYGALDIDGSGFAECKYMKSLKGLHIDTSQIDLGLLPAFENLETLSISSITITDDTMVHLQSLKRLKDLSIHSTRITERGLAHLSTLRLKRLVLWGDMSSIRCLSEMPLEVLILDNNFVLEDSALECITLFHSLCSISISKCPKLTSACLDHILNLHRIRPLRYVYMDVPKTFAKVHDELPNHPKSVLEEYDGPHAPPRDGRDRLGRLLDAEELYEEIHVYG